MQLGLRQGLVNSALIGAKRTTTLQHQCNPLERRAFSRDMGFAQQRSAARRPRSSCAYCARCSAPPVLRSILGDMKGDIELDGGPMPALGC